MSGDALALALVGAVLVGGALLFGRVIEWFGYRRHGHPADHRSVGIGFVSAGAIAWLVLAVTDGPWVVGLAFIVAGLVYLAWPGR